MPIALGCGSCKTRIEVPESAAGRIGKCRTCGAVVKVPGGPSKICSVCGADVTQAKRSKDATGNYLCEDCAVPAVPIRSAAAPMELATDAAPAICSICGQRFSYEQVVDIGGVVTCRSCNAANRQRSAAALSPGITSSKAAKSPVGAIAALIFGIVLISGGVLLWHLHEYGDPTGAVSKQTAVNQAQTPTPKPTASDPAVLQQIRNVSLIRNYTHMAVTADALTRSYNSIVEKNDLDNKVDDARGIDTTIELQNFNRRTQENQDACDKLVAADKAVEDALTQIQQLNARDPAGCRAAIKTVEDDPDTTIDQRIKLDSIHYASTLRGLASLKLSAGRVESPVREDEVTS